MKLNRSKKGFTLVEIMIVVVIIGLLAAMAIPAFQKVRKNSVSKTVLNDARQIAGAAQQLLLQHPATDANITIAYDTNPGAISTNLSTGGNIQDYLQKISKGYAGNSIVYLSGANAASAAFNLTLNGISPRDLNPSNTAASNNPGDPINFDTEGKPL